MRKTILLIILTICFSMFQFPAYAGSHKGFGKAGYLKRGSLDKGRTNKYGRDGSSKGYLKRDSLFKTRVNIYNEKGERKGYLKKDTLFKDQTNVINETGKRKVYLKKDSLFEDRTNNITGRETEKVIYGKTICLKIGRILSKLIENFDYTFYSIDTITASVSPVIVTTRN